MHPRATEFAEQAAEAYDFDVEVQEFPEGTKTAADAADAVGCDVAQIAKSIVMSADRKVDGADRRETDLVVVLTSGDHRVDEAALADQLDAESVESASPSQVRETLGWSIGGVPPFCHDADVETLFDTTLAEYDEVWAAAGTPEAVFPIDPDRLRELSDATPTTAVE